MSKTKRQLLFLLVSFSAATNAATAQLYHKSYGASKIVQQSQTGLFYSDPSYISPGTLSRSARGLAPGMTVGFAASSAPPVRWGGFIRQPGDGLYNGADGTIRMDNGCVNYGDNLLLAQLIQMKKEMRIQQRRQYLNSLRRISVVEQGNLYIPGSNGSASSYGCPSTISSYPSYK